MTHKTVLTGHEMGQWTRHEDFIIKKYSEIYRFNTDQWICMKLQDNGYYRTPKAIEHRRRAMQGLTVLQVINNEEYEQT